MVLISMSALVETTAMVLAETLALLAIHQDEQELAYQELLSELGGQDELVSI